jgi:hypothetical protein
MAFQKYQGEQVQQIPAGYVEAMGSMGKAYQQFGASVSAGLQEADKRAQEEAKLQGALSPYLRNDPRTKAVDDALSTGLLKKDEAGNVVIPDESKDRLNLATAQTAIDFYNKTGGDGSKLKGVDLTRFATQFEAEQKYKATQDAAEDKRLERLKTKAEIDKLNADAKAKSGEVAANAVMMNYAAGTDTVPASAPAPSLNLPTVNAPTYDYNIPAQPTAPRSSFETPGFSVDRYNAGTDLSGQLRTAPLEAAPVVTTPKAQAPAQVALPLPKPLPETGPVTDVIALAGQERQVLTERYQASRSALMADHSRAMANLAKTGGASPEVVKQMNETLKIRLENLDNQSKANLDLIDKRVAGATAVASERRAQAGEKRAEVQTQAQYGVETPPTTPAPAAPTTPPKTFKEGVTRQIGEVGKIPGRTGGTAQVEARRAAREEHNEIMQSYPDKWNIGVFHEGAKEYQLDNLGLQAPVIAGVPAGARMELQQVINGYAEAQTFLTELSDIVESTDENRITNYLNRMLLTARADAKGTIVTGDMMNQFGVAAFRRAIVSGGNFSDADREYVAKLITNINSPNVLKDKALFRQQTQALADFIDRKYRSTLSAYNMRFDTATSREFLQREGRTAELKQLEKTEQYVRTFGIDTGNTKEIKAPEDMPALYDQKAEMAEKAGNAGLAKQLRAEADARRQGFAEAEKRAIEAAKRSQKK